MDVNRLREARKAAGLTIERVADAVGLSVSQISRIETGRREPRAIDVEKMLELYGTVPMPSIVRTGFKPPPKFVGEHELPVYASVEAGPGEMIISTDQPIDVVPRPWFMGTVTDGYAVLVVGESMVPAFEPGDYAIVNPRLTKKRDKDVILTGGEEEGEFRATIKRLVNWTTDEWLLRQFNPPEGAPKEFRLPRRDWPNVLLVVGRWISS